MESNDIRKKFFNFFENKNHKIIKSSSLIPSDSTVLFNSAGMQQFNTVLSGEEDVVKKFGSRILTSCQKCFRSNDIQEVGDDTHNTFFEMLGNWSVGKDDQQGYFKEKAIEYALEFFCNVLRLDKNKIWVTIFKGEGSIPKDEESIKIWQKNGIPKERIVEFGMQDNFWGPVASIGPCGPCSEIHYDRGKEFGCGKEDCGPNCPNCQRFVELWNLVFMEYNKNENAKYIKLSQKNVDTGIGFERLISILQNKSSAYETDLFLPLIKTIEALSDKKYEDAKKSFRVISDHIRGAVFLIAEGIIPSNVSRGYILRRVLRSSIRHAEILNLKKYWYIDLIERVIEIYKEIYPEIGNKKTDIITIIQNEEEKFKKTLKKGLIEFNRIKKLNAKENSNIITGAQAFDLYQSYGTAIGTTMELAKEVDFEVDIEDFKKRLKQHQEISRAGAEKKFGGHGIKENGDKDLNFKIIKLHTATHLLQAALRNVLGNEVEQMGSNINSERLRFDFSFNRRLTDQEIEKVEHLVNQKIKEGLSVMKKEMPVQEALKSGALSFFKEKYPEIVKVYTIINQKTGQIFSKEVCAGPHVKNISELNLFKITKQESSGSNIRRIKAIIK
jgi:alanyl-tRNA synthetase